MKPSKLFSAMCLIGLSTLLFNNSSSAQNRIYANYLADSSSDFNASRLSIDTHLNNFAYINAEVGVLSSSHLSFRFPTSGRSGDAISVQIQSDGLLGASVLNNITLQLYDSLGVNVGNASGSNILQLSLLSSADNIYAVRFITDINANYTFKTVVVELNNVLSANLLNEFRVYGVFFQPSCPAVKANTVHAYGTNALLTGFVVNPNNAVDSDPSTYAHLEVPLSLIGLPGPAYLDLNFGIPGNAGEYVGFTVSESSSILSLALLGTVSITAFDANNTIVASKTGFTLLDLKLLDGSSDRYSLGFVTPAGTYTINRLRIDLTGAIGLLESINVHDAFHYRIDATPVAISASGDLTMCNDSTVTLTANMPSSGNSFVWNTGATSPSITVDATGSYSVTVIDGVGCSYSSIPVSVTELAPAPATINTTHITCNGDNNGAVQITIASGADPHTCLWNTGSTNFNPTALIPDTYTATITNTVTGCITIFTVQINEPAPLTTSPSSIQETCGGNDGIILMTINGGTAPYTITTSAGIVQGYEIIGLTTGNYSVNIKDANGCQTNTIQAITKVDCTTPITIHNVITPNDDGLNDVLVIEGIERYPNSDLMVFDKWGDKVYEDDHYTNSWTGSTRSKEEALPAGTYFYLLKLNAEEVPHGQSDYTGYILIQR